MGTPVGNKEKLSSFQYALSWVREGKERVGRESPICSLCRQIHLKGGISGTVINGVEEREVFGREEYPPEKQIL